MRQRSLTSVLFDKNLQASTMSKIKLNDERRRASIRLERRKTIQSQPNSNKKSLKHNIRRKGMDREPSITSKLTLDQRVGEELLRVKIDQQEVEAKARLLKRRATVAKDKSVNKHVDYNFV